MSWMNQGIVCEPEVGQPIVQWLAAILLQTSSLSSRLPVERKKKLPSIVGSMAAKMTYVQGTVREELTRGEFRAPPG
jgi:hypothetical protein